MGNTAPTLTVEIARRFLSHVDLADDAGHHRWLGAYSEKRHFPPRPVFWVAGSVVPAFRVALALHDGTSLDQRVHLYACHKPECAQPWCVNPLHGYWGTVEENRWDRYGSSRRPAQWLERSYRG